MKPLHAYYYYTISDLTEINARKRIAAQQKHIKPRQRFKGRQRLQIMINESSAMTRDISGANLSTRRQDKPAGQNFRTRHLSFGYY